MSESQVFDPVAERLENATSLTRLEARGTLRLTLKEAGFDAGNIRPAEIRVAIERLLPVELEVRGIEDAQNVCGELVSFVDTLSTAPQSSEESPEEIFRRLGGD